MLLSCKTESKIVHLKGELKSFGTEVFMSKGTPDELLLKEGLVIKLDAQNKFEISFELDEPSYYRLGRNTLYLSPGDELELFCDFKKPMAAKFTGSGADACLYLCAKPFPKGGSFLEAGKMIKDDPSFDDVLNRLDQKIEARLTQLKETPNLSNQFRKLEKGRVMFGAANTLFSYTAYASRIKKLTKEEAKVLNVIAEARFKNAIDKFLAEGGDVDYLNLDVYRDICRSCIELLGEKNVDQAIIDYTKTRDLLSQLLRNGATSELVEQKVVTLNQLQGDKYKTVINEAFKKYNALLSGQLAPELAFRNKDGEEVRLSDFKGKVVVLDVWATWCGPCVKQSPYFEKLAEKYKNQNIEFLAISIDSNKKAWEKYLEKHPKSTKQLITNRTVFAAYLIHGIPRFMVFDSKGLIVDAFAARPSDPKLEKLINSCL